jgi:phosphatidate cytidylyltransferase
MSAPMEARKSLDPFAMDAEDPRRLMPDLDRPVSTASKTAPRLADLLPRLVSSLALMALALAAWWFGGDIFVVIWLAAAIAVFCEWQRIIGGTAERGRFLTGSLFLVLVAAFTSRMDVGFAWLSLALAAALMAALAGSGRRLWAASGFLYAGCLIGSLCLLSNDTAFGPRAILWLFAIVWGTDVCAYFAGRLLGGPKIWPRISPGKTWSGTLIGIGCGAALGAFVGVKGLPEPVSLLHVLGLSMMTAVVAQAGDMFESWMKRRFGVKDSGRLIPGHGGLMDRLDGFIAAAVFAVMIGLLHGGTSLTSGLFNWH